MCHGAICSTGTVLAAYHGWRWGSHQAASIAHVHQSLQALSKLAGRLTTPLQGIIMPGAVAEVLSNVKPLLLHKGLANLSATAGVWAYAAICSCNSDVNVKVPRGLPVLCCALQQVNLSVTSEAA